MMKCRRPLEVNVPFANGGNTERRCELHYCALEENHPPPCKDRYGRTEEPHKVTPVLHIHMTPTSAGWDLTYVRRGVGGGTFTIKATTVNLEATLNGIRETCEMVGVETTNLPPVTE